LVLGRQLGDTKALDFKEGNGILGWASMTISCFMGAEFSQQIQKTAHDRIAFPKKETLKRPPQSVKVKTVKTSPQS